MAQSFKNLHIHFQGMRGGMMLRFAIDTETYLGDLISLQLFANNGCEIYLDRSVVEDRTEGQR